MTSDTFTETILGAIEDAYPCEEKPAQNAYLRDLYTTDPEPSPAMVCASVGAGICVRRVQSACPHLSDLAAEAVGMEQFCEEFAETLEEQARGTFRAARNCGV